LHYGGQVNATDNKDETALTEACHGGPWKQVIAATIDRFTAAAVGRIDLLKHVLHEGNCGIDEIESRGCRTLPIAAHNNRFSDVLWLVARGADINRADAVSAAALHRVSQQCTDEIIQYLIDMGADAHLCCYVAYDDETGTRQPLRHNEVSANEIFYKFNTMNYAGDSWQIANLRILLDNDCTWSVDEEGQMLRITNIDAVFLKELKSGHADNADLQGSGFSHIF
jgi:ankyrin repeat protein